MIEPTIDPPSDSTKVQRNIAKLKAAGADAAEIEKYLRSEGGMPADAVDAHADAPALADNAWDRFTNSVSGAAHGALQTATFGKADELAAGLGAALGENYDERLATARGADSTAAANDPWAYQQGEALGALAPTGAGVAKVGKPMLGAVKGLVGKGVSAAKTKGSVPVLGAALAGSLVVPGFLGGNFIRYHAGRKLIEQLTHGAGRKPDALSRALSGGAKAEAPLATAPSNLFQKAEQWSTPEYLAAQEAKAGQSMWKQGIDELAPPPAAPTPVTMEQGFARASQEAAKRGSGTAMDEGIAALKPAVPELTGTPMKAGMKVAGQEATERGSGLAMDMQALSGAAKSAPLKTPLSQGLAGQVEKWGMKPDALNAAAGGAAMNPAQALQGFEMPQELVPPPPLSSNASEARSVGLQGLAMGQPLTTLRQQLALTYDPATVEFVLAALPNRMPQ